MTVVTIDGPAGSGKSTIAHALAAELGLPHVDTGAFYRAATLAVLRAGADVRSPTACAAVISDVHITRREGRTCLDGEDVEAEIRGPEVTAAVSAVSAHAQVRALLLARQRAQVDASGAVIEGRDAGTAVAPDALLKVWLTASAEERATRRAAQLGDEGPEAIAEHRRRIADRDRRDAAQMVPAPDAVVVDTTGRSVDEIVTELAGAARARAGTTRGRGTG